MRLDQLVQQHESAKTEKITELEFIIEGEPYQQFGRTFDSFEDCLRYCDKNGIPYTKERSFFGSNAYDFPTA